MKILIFAGTTEGRKLIDKLIHLKEAEDKQFEGLSICACTATEYGKDILESEYSDKVDIRAKRLNESEMKSLIIDNDFDIVIDATHPYAVEVTRNIKAACEQTKGRYIRLLRDKTDFGEDCVFVEDTEKAVDFLNKTKGNCLLTVGSKELAKYTKVNAFEQRLYARVLPMPQVLKSCNDLGFAGKHLICMQGPFSCELNIAMLRQLECEYLVTKDTGKEGGAYEKYMAAKAVGATLLVVGRSTDETGSSIDEIISELNDINHRVKSVANKEVNNLENNEEPEKQEELGNKEEENEAKIIENKKLELADWFPMFVNLNNRNIAIVGAGKIAMRRIKALLQFSCNLRVIAKEVSDENRVMIKMCQDVNSTDNKNRSIEIYEKEFEIDDIIGADIVITATNNCDLNKKIGQQCKEQGILVNIADSKEDCDFYFPGVAVKGELVAGVTAQGKNHGLAKKAAVAMRKAFEDINGDKI